MVSLIGENSIFVLVVIKTAWHRDTKVNFGANVWKLTAVRMYIHQPIIFEVILPFLAHWDSSKLMGSMAICKNSPRVDCFVAIFCVYEIRFMTYVPHLGELTAAM